MADTLHPDKLQSDPVLRDGTHLSDLIDMDMREVKMRVLSDPDLYEIEMKKVFARCWLLVGHESEIPNKGDFIQRDMGSDSVIVAKDAKGDIHVSLNVCPHRGMRITTLESGNANSHVCIYHGWAFKPNGDFIGSPIASECMHGTMRSKEELGLRKARVAIWGGLIFATFDQDGPSFEEFMGDAKWYFDTLFDRTDSGMELLGPPQRFNIRANWKTACEQSAADGFHTLTLHRWLAEVGPYAKKPDAEGKGGDLSPEMYGCEVWTDHGHALRCIELDRKIARLTGKDPDTLTVEEKLTALPPPGITREMVPELLRRFSKDQLEVMAWRPPQVGGFFPNGLFEFIYLPQPDGTIVGAMALHVYVPKGPDKLEFTNYIFAERDTPPELKAKMLRLSIQMLGTSGLVEQDDSDTWPHQTLAAKGAVSKDITLKYQACYDNKGPENWPGPGHVGEGFTKDDTQWAWWRYYHELMTAPD